MRVFWNQAQLMLRIKRPPSALQQPFRFQNDRIDETRYLTNPRLIQKSQSSRIKKELKDQITRSWVTEEERSVPMLMKQSKTNHQLKTKTDVNIKKVYIKWSLNVIRIIEENWDSFIRCMDTLYSFNRNHHRLGYQSDDGAFHPYDPGCESSWKKHVQMYL